MVAYRRLSACSLIPASVDGVPVAGAMRKNPSFRSGVWPDLLLPKVARADAKGASSEGSDATGRYWMLSLYSPASGDSVDWRSGDYTLTVRGGRVESKRSSGDGKKVGADGRRRIRARRFFRTCWARGRRGARRLRSSGIPVRFGVSAETARIAIGACRRARCRMQLDRLQNATLQVEEPQTEEAVIEPCEPALRPESAQETEPAPEAAVTEEPVQELPAQDEIVAEQPAEPSARYRTTRLPPPSRIPKSHLRFPRSPDDAL